MTAIGLFIFSGFNNPTNYILAIFGVINVLLAFILALLVTESKKVALIAPAFLAVLPLHVFYSRLSMAEMDSQFFFLLSLIFYILRIKKGKLIYWWLTSIAITLALVTNGDRFAFITPIIIELFLYRRQAIRQIFIFGLVFSVGMILSEIPYHIAFLLTHNYKIIIENPSYLEQQLWILARLTGFGLKINLLSFLSYPYMILNTTGYLFSIFLVLGIIKTIRSKNKLEIVSLVSFSSTLLFLSIHSLQALRAISPILPLFAIEASIGLLFIIKYLSAYLKNRLMLVGILLILILATIFELVLNSLPLLNYTSPYLKTMSILTSQNAKHIVTTTDAIFKSVNPNIQTINYQNTLGVGDFSIKGENSPEFIVTNIQKYTIPTRAINLTKDIDKTTDLIQKNCSPVYSSYDINSHLLVKLFAFEHNSSINKTTEFLNKFHIPEDGRLNIYKFRECIEQISSS